MNCKRFPGMFAVVLVLFLVMAAGCAESPPPVVEEIYGSGGPMEAQGVVRTQGSTVSGAPSVSVTAQFSCGQLAQKLGPAIAGAGCYNHGDNWNQVPKVIGGSCAATWDCDCCFLAGWPPQAADWPMASVLVEGVEIRPFSPEQEPVSAPTPLPMPSPVEEPREPLLDKLPNLLTWSRNTALVVTGILLVPFIVSVVLLESETLGGSSSTWLPLAAMVYIVLFGILLTHIWFPFIMREVPFLTGVTVPVPGVRWVRTLYIVGFLVLLAVGGYLARSEQVPPKVAALGYLFIFLVGFGLHWILGLKDVLPIRIS